jgi:putative ABC transport system permease protein
MTRATPACSRLRAADVISAGSIGVRSRPARAALSVLGIAIGIAALVSVLGITSSSEASLLDQIDRLGTNLLTVVNGQSVIGQEVELPATATPMISRIPGVETVAPTAEISGVGVYRTDAVPAVQTGGIGVRAAGPSLLAALGAHLREGVFLNPATANYPAAVLGYQAARTLGLSRPEFPARIWIGQTWFTVTGILDPIPLAPEIDQSVLIGFPAAAHLFGYDQHPTRIYVRADVARVASVYSRLAATANPQGPDQVGVSRPSDVLTARIAVASASTSLFIGLGAVALLVGGIGIANVMVIGVLERRAEIGLRRALGANRRHIALQFLAESLLLAALGGGAGIVIGSTVTTATALLRHWTPTMPAVALWGGLLTADLIGAVAGLYPAARAARLSPTDALRTVA